MSTQLSKRERVLATVVGVVVLVVLNLWVISYFVKNHRRLRAELGAKAAQLSTNKLLFADKDMWAEREAWLKKVQPKLENEGKAAVNLKDEIDEVAKKTNLQVLEPQLGTVGRNAHAITVFVTIQAKASKEALRDFLYEMQTPERSIVFESASLQFDKDDKTQMHGTFRIAKWFAPK